MRRRSADTAGSKEALTIIPEKYRKINGSVDVMEFEHAVIEMCAENDLSNSS